MAKKILVIEDSPTIMEIKCSVLEEAGYQTIRATEGIEGIQKVREEKPDLILLDIKLPDMDGYQVCRMLKSDEELKHIPVVMATASKIEKKDEFWGFQVGADGYIVEPFEPEELIDVVERVLGVTAEKK